MTFKLSIFDTVAQSSEGAWLHLTVPGSRNYAYLDGHLENPKKPLRIHLKGADSDTYAKEIQRINRKERKAEMQQRGKIKEKSLEEIVLEWAELFAKMTLGWENIPDDDGKPLPFTFENAVKLYISYKDIRVQAGLFIDTQENFIKTSATD